MKKFMLASLFLVVATRADVLHLRNGESVEGKFISGNGATIWFQQALHEAAEYPVSLVESVTFSPVPSLSATWPITPGTEPQAAAHSRIAAGK